MQVFRLKKTLFHLVPDEIIYIQMSAEAIGTLTRNALNQWFSMWGP